MSDVSHIRAAGRIASQRVQAAHSAAGLPEAPEWAGYWTFVTATIVIMFILFTARKGTLSTWISFLSWSAPRSLLTPPAGQTADSATSAVNSAVSAGNSIASGLNGIAGAANNIGKAIGGFFGGSK